MMTNMEAVEIVKARIEQLKVHVEYLKSRRIKMQLDQERDPWEGNATQIERFTTRIANVEKEVEALDIVLNGYPED